MWAEGWCRRSKVVLSFQMDTIDESLGLAGSVKLGVTLRKQEERHIQAFENKWIGKLLRIRWTKLMTTAQVYKIVGMENELLKDIKSRKVQFFRYVMRQPHDNVEGSVMVGLVEGT